jgi:ribosome-associated toxin RatA of RatAB toxin-antitoxin module
MKIVREILINSPLEHVYNAYADIEKWRNILDDVVSIQIFYDDGIHQEFDMTVQRGDNHETVHSIRFCFPNQKIEIFQTSPPPNFKFMSGVWKFVSENNNTLVRATRNFEVYNKTSFDCSLLEKFLEKNLLSFKRRLENDA